MIEPVISAPEQTEEPTATQTPAAVDAPPETQAPAQTQVPAGTQEPVAGGTPEATDAPLETEVPAETMAPDETVTPEQSPAPDSTPDPEQAVGSTPPETTEIPESTAMPEETLDPQASPEPLETIDPQATTEVPADIQATPEALSIAGYDPSISVSVEGGSTFLTGSRAKVDIIVAKEAGSQPQGAFVLRLSITDRYIRDISAGALNGAAPAITRDEQAGAAYISYFLKGLNGGDRLVVPLSFTISDEQVPVGYQFSIGVTLDLVADQVPEPQAEMADAVFARSFSLPGLEPEVVDAGSTTQEPIKADTALVPPVTFHFQLMNTSALSGTVEMTITGSAVQTNGTAVSTGISLSRTAGAEAIPGPLTVTYTIPDNSLVDPTSLTAGDAANPAAITSNPDTKVTTIAFTLADGLAADANLTLPISFQTIAGTAEGALVPVSASLDSDTQLAAANAGFTFFNPVSISLAGPGSYRIGASVEARALLTRPADAPAIPGPLTVEFAFHSIDMLDISSISGVFYDGSLPSYQEDLDNGKVSLSYTLPNGLAPGADIKLPMYFSSKTTAPDGTVILLQVRLLSGDTVLASAGGDYTFKSLDPSISFDFRPEPNPDRWTYYTYEEVVYYVDYNKVAGSGSITNGRIRFLFDENKYIYKFTASDLGSALSKQYISDSAGKIIGVDYLFTNLTPGQALSIPMEVTTQPFVTPDGYELGFTATVLEEDGAGNLVEVTPGTTGSFTFEVLRPQLNKYLGGNRYVDYTPTQTVFGGLDRNNDGLIDTDAAGIQRFTFGLVIPRVNLANSSMGVRAFNPIVITDTLPEGAVFDPAINPGWSLVPGSSPRQVTYTHTQNVTVYNTGSTVQIAPLLLSFPGLAYQGTPVVNHAKMVLTPRDGESYELDNGTLTLEDDITVYFNTRLANGSISKTSNPTTIPDQLFAKENTEVSFSLYVRNPSQDFHMDNIIFNDYNLDPRLVFTGVSINSTYARSMIGPDGNVGTGTFSILALRADDSVTATLAQSVSGTTTTVYRDLPADTAKLRIMADPGTKLAPLSSFYTTVYAKLRDPANTAFNPSSYSANNMYNYAAGSYTWAEPDIDVTLPQTLGIVRLVEYVPKLTFTKSINAAASYFLNETATVTLAVTEPAGSILQNPDKINGLRLVDLLPEHVEYVEGSSTFANWSSNPDNNYAYISVEPEVVPNYKGGTRTALIWDYSSISARPSQYAGTYIRVTFRMRMTAQTPPLTNFNDAYAIWENNAPNQPADKVQQIQPSGTTVFDTLDLDNDGNTSEKVLLGRASFVFTPPAELIVYKTVKGNLDEGFVGTGGRSYIGGKVDFRITILNKSEVAIKQATVLDVLPLVGDYTTAPDSNGGYSPRGSSFPVRLTGPVTGGAAGASFNIYYNYTAKTTGQSPATYAAGPGWTSAVGDYSLVRGIKIEMASGELAKDQSATFTLPATTPFDIRLRDGQKANNTAAVSTGGSYTESSFSSIVINNIVIQGTAFRDYNENSLKDGSPEPGIPGVKVRLMMLARDENGNEIPGNWVPALDYIQDANGNLVPNGEITAVTDLYGRYKMEAYYAGTYKVVFERPSNHLPTETGAVTNPVASHIIPDTQPAATADETATFTVTTSQYRFTRNAGYIYGLSDLKITKELRSQQGSLIAQNSRDFSYRVLINGQPYTKDNGVELHTYVQGVLSVSFVTPDANGVFTMQNGNIAWIRGLNRNTDTYSVTEMESGLYEATPAGGQYTGTVTTNETQLAFLNRETNNAKLTVTKELRDTNNTVITPTDAVFYFRAWGVSLPGSATTGGETFQLKAGESKVFENLQYGIYTVREYTDDTYTTIMPGNHPDYIVSYSANGGLFGIGYYNYTATASFASRDNTVVVRNTQRPAGKLEVIKTLYDRNGNKLSDVRSFQYQLSGQDFTYNLTNYLSSNAANPVRYNTLKYGTYTLQETNVGLAHELYDISYIFNDGKDPATVFTQTDGATTPLEFDLTFENRAYTHTIEIRNTEKDVGTFTVTKVLRDARGYLITNDTRPFEVTISGDNLPADYPDKTRTFTAQTPAVFENLPYGTYTVTETQSGLYTPYYSPAGAQEITFNSRAKFVTITNYENDAGELRMVKEVYSADGTKVEDGREFWVYATGPQLTGSRKFKITNDVDAVTSATSLRFGTYTLTEITEPGYEDLSNYNTTTNGVAGLTATVEVKAYDPDDPDSHIQTVTFVNREVPNGKLTISKQLRDSLGNILPADAARTFNATVFGPSYPPEGKPITITNSQPYTLPDAADIAAGISGLKYGTYTVVEDLTGFKYDTAASVTTGTASLSITAQNGAVNLINQEKADGGIYIKKVLLDEDGTIHTTSRDLVFDLSGSQLAAVLSKTLTTGGIPFDPNAGGQQPGEPVGPRDGVGYVSFGNAGPNPALNTEGGLAYGTYSMAEFLPRYLGTVYENNMQAELVIRPGIDNDETWAAAKLGTLGEDYFIASGNTFNIALDVDNPVREYTLYNRLTPPRDGEFKVTKLFIGGKLDAAHPHSAAHNMMKLYRKVASETTVFEMPGPIEVNPTQQWITNNPTLPYLVITDVTADLAANDPFLDLAHESYFTYHWTNLPKYSTGTTLYQYYATEANVPAWYTVEYPSSALAMPGSDGALLVTNGTTITNRYTPGTVSASIEKKWFGGPQPLPMEVPFVFMRSYEVALEGGGTETVVEPGRQHTLTEQLVNGEMVWQKTFTDLPAADSYGRLYTYYALEGILENGQYVATAPENYEVSYAHSAAGGVFSSTLSNTYSSPLMDVTATKQWHVDAESAGFYPGAYIGARNDIWMQLYRLPGLEATPAEAEPVGSRQKMPADSGTQALTWTGLPKTMFDGTEYTYFVREVGENGEEGWAPLNFYAEHLATEPLTVHNRFTKTEDRKGEITITKTLLDAAGVPYGVKDENGVIAYPDPAQREFTIVLYGPFGYRQPVTLKAGESTTITKLAYGTYHIVEDDMGSVLYEAPVYSAGADALVLSQTADPDDAKAAASVTNQEKPLGELRLYKLLEDADGNPILEKRYPTVPGASEPDERPFTFLVTGPLYPGQPEPDPVEVTVYSNRVQNPAALTGLAYGTYRISEKNTEVTDNANVSDLYVMPASVDVTIGIDSPLGTATLTNREKALGNLAIRKTLLDASGNKITDGRAFDVLVEGETLEAPRTYRVPAGGMALISGLEFGEYTVVELDSTNAYATGYSLTADGEPTGQSITVALSLEPNVIRLGQTVYITNKELENASLTLSKRVYNTQGGIGSSSPNPPVFLAEVTGPNDYKHVVRLPADGSPNTISNLRHGTYAIREIEPEEGYKLADYTVTNPADVVLGYDSQSQTVELNGAAVVENRELPLGSLLVSLQIVANQKDADGQPIMVTDPRGFQVTVTGPSFPDGKVIEVTNGIPNDELTALLYGGYEITGIADVNGNSIDHLYITTLIRPSDTLHIDKQSGELMIQLRELPLGVLTVSAEVLDADGNPVPDGREVTVTVHGPSFPAEGREVTIVTGEPFPVLSGLVYGEYTVTAEDQGYTVTLPEPVTLSINNKEGNLHTLFEEEDDGKLILSAEVLDAQGKEVPDGREVTVTVYGPSFPEGEKITIITGDPFPVLEGLAYGEYHVEAEDPNYIITLPEPVTLKHDNKEDRLHTVLKEPAVAKLTISAEVLDAQGKEVPPGREVTVIVYGPSFPEGKKITIVTGQPFPVLEDLAFGEYRIEADDPQYIITLPKPVTLSRDQMEGTMHTVFQERQAYEVTLGVLVYDENGREIRPDITFIVWLYGPDFLHGKAFEIRPGMKNAQIVKNLSAGYWFVRIQNPGEYRVALPDSLLLSNDNPKGQLIIKLYTRVPQPALGSITYHVGDTVE